MPAQRSICAKIQAKTRQAFHKAKARRKRDEFLRLMETQPIYIGSPGLLRSHAHRAIRKKGA